MVYMEESKKHEKMLFKEMISRLDESATSSVRPLNSTVHETI